MPDSLIEWLTAVGTATAILAAWTGALFSLFRLWVKQVVRESVDASTQPIRLELQTMNGEMGRIRIIEQKIENGLSSDVGELKTDVRELREGQNDILSHLAWDGVTERRKRPR